jgi:hypothetical protein
MEPKASTSPKMEKALMREQHRIKVLRQYAVLDSEPEQEFDDLAAMAAHICGTPIALISLVDDNRQWFKSKVGLKINETPRSHSFCAHALENPDEILVVPDATRDDRFFKNPLVTGDPSIRFYAGAPLLTSEDAVLGTVCVIDRVPRELTETQQWMLRALSRQVVRKLENRHATIEAENVSVLPAGLHDLDLIKLQALICADPTCWGVWFRLLSFLGRPILDQRFSYAYVGGTFLPKDRSDRGLKVTLQPTEPYGPSGFEPLSEYFVSRQERIRTMYSIDLRFWVEGLPVDILCNEPLFLPHPPWINDEKQPVPVARINLKDPTIVHQFHRMIDPFPSTGGC